MIAFPRCVLLLLLLLIAAPGTVVATGAKLVHETGRRHYKANDSEKPFHFLRTCRHWKPAVGSVTIIHRVVSVRGYREWPTPRHKHR